MSGKVRVRRTAAADAVLYHAVADVLPLLRLVGREGARPVRSLRQRLRGALEEARHEDLVRHALLRVVAVLAEQHARFVLCQDKEVSRLPFHTAVWSNNTVRH